MESILVGVDFSPSSDSALRTAFRIAGQESARLTAVHVIGATLYHDLVQHIALVDNELTAEATLFLEAHLEKVLGAGHGVVAESVIGHPFLELMASAERHSAELLVMGSHGARSDDPWRVGVVAGKCVRKSPVNVLLVRDAGDRPFRKVVACVDFSPTSKKAARHAIHIAMREKAELDFLHIYQPLISYFTTNIGYYSKAIPTVPVRLPDIDADRVERELVNWIRPLIEEAGGYGFGTRVEKHFDMRRSIGAYVKQNEVDLLVLGTRGQSTFRDLLIGTSAEKIVQHASCAILAVKPDAPQPDAD